MGRVPGVEWGVVQPDPAGPFDRSGIVVGADGVRRYEGLHRNLVALLRDTASRFPGRTAVTELGGASVTYVELERRALRVAGGLRAAGVGVG